MARPELYQDAFHNWLPANGCELIRPIPGDVKRAHAIAELTPRGVPQSFLFSVDLNQLKLAIGELALRRSNRWWITTGSFSNGGNKMAGPFHSQELAIEVRGYLERSSVAYAGKFCVDEEEEI